jgi:hypothetical protein
MSKERKSKIPILFYLSLALISLVIVGTTVSFFLDGRINFNGLDEDIFGQFGDFIAGVAGTLINLLAVVLLWINYLQQKRDTEETKRLFNLQIGLSMKPDLCFSHTEIFAYTVENFLYPVKIFNRKVSETSPEMFSVFKVDLINAGVGTAKGIRYRWIYNLKDVVHFITSNFDLKDIQLEVGRDRCWVKIEKSGNGTTQSSISYQELEDIDVVLSYRDEKDKVQVSYPDAYIRLYLIAIQFCFEQKKFDPFGSGMPEFPPAIIELNYSDLVGNSHLKHFTFDLKFNGFTYAKEGDQLVLQGKLIAREADY